MVVVCGDLMVVVCGCSGDLMVVVCGDLMIVVCGCLTVVFCGCRYRDEDDADLASMETGFHQQMMEEKRRSAQIQKISVSLYTK